MFPHFCKFIVHFELTLRGENWGISMASVNQALSVNLARSDYHISWSKIWKGVFLWSMPLICHRSCHGPMSLSPHISLERALSAMCNLTTATLWDTFFCRVMTFKDVLNGKHTPLSHTGSVLGIGTLDQSKNSCLAHLGQTFIILSLLTSAWNWKSVFPSSKIRSLKLISDAWVLTQ